jgi:hypothetical protein
MQHLYAKTDIYYVMVDISIKEIDHCTAMSVPVIIPGWMSWFPFTGKYIDPDFFTFPLREYNLRPLDPLSDHLYYTLAKETLMINHNDKQVLEQIMLLRWYLRFLQTFWWQWWWHCGNVGGMKGNCGGIKGNGAGIWEMVVAWRGIVVALREIVLAFGKWWWHEGELWWH